MPSGAIAACTRSDGVFRSDHQHAPGAARGTHSLLEPSAPFVYARFTISSMSGVGIAGMGARADAYASAHPSTTPRCRDHHVLQKRTYLFGEHPPCRASEITTRGSRFAYARNTSVMLPPEMRDSPV